MSSIQILQEFQTSLLAFIDELIQLMPHCGEFIAVKIFVKDRIPITEIIKHFVKIIIPMEGLIKSRSDHVIIDNAIFKQIDPQEKIKEIWGQIDADDRDMMWKWIEHFLAITKKYNALITREP